MSQLELNQDPTREQSKYSQEDYQNDTWHQTHNRKRRWQREHAIADDLSDHEHGDELP